MKEGLSIVVITFNEASRIEATLRAAKKLANDIVVVDAESTDDTVKMASILGARTFVRPWQGFASAKNFGAIQAKHNWIFSLDADEVLSDELIESIHEIPLEADHLYMVNIFTKYVDQWLRFGGNFPNFKKRIYNKLERSWGGNSVHEQLEVLPNTKLIKLDGVVYHYSFSSIEHHQEKAKSYAKIAAAELLDKKKHPNALKRSFGPAFRFFKEFVLLMGFMDGKAGFQFAKIQSKMVRWRYEFYDELIQKDNPT